MKQKILSVLLVVIMIIGVVPIASVSAANPIDGAVSWALGIANDARYGYDQTYRWGELSPAPGYTNAWDYDCSSFLITAWQKAGVAVKTAGASYTGNMKTAFISQGFKDITSSINLSSGSGLKKGDVLLKSGSHTAMVSAVSGSSITIVHASINEKGTATGGVPGDQTGKEICTRSYYNFATCVLRYGSTTPPPSSSYYPQYTGSSTSLVEALNAVGVDSSYDNRKAIAAANGISNYSGTAAQNTELLNKLKAGVLIRAGSAVSYYPKYTGSSTSLVEALNAVGVDSSYNNRKLIAAANGISNYSGTAAQNTELLNKLKAGTLIRA